MTLFTQEQRLLVDHVLVLRLIDVVMLSVHDVIVAEVTRGLLLDRGFTLNRQSISIKLSSYVS
jgi:hypothetical protein